MFRQLFLDNLTDEELMALVQRGDRTAFGHLYDRHSSLALGVACRILRDRGSAEDAVQESFVAVWRDAARFDPSRGNLRSWVLGVVRHRSIDAARREQRPGARTARSDDDGAIERLDDGGSISEEVEQRDEARSLRAAVDDLPPDQRTAIELAYFGGLTHTEIAARLVLPLGTVKGRMRLALTKLRPFCEPLAPSGPG